MLQRQQLDFHILDPYIVVLFGVRWGCCFVGADARFPGLCPVSGWLLSLAVFEDVTVDLWDVYLFVILDSAIVTIDVEGQCFVLVYESCFDLL